MIIDRSVVAPVHGKGDFGGLNTVKYIYIYKERNVSDYSLRRNTHRKEHENSHRN